MIELDAQLEAFDKLADEAYDRLILILVRNRERYVAEARQRLIDGFPEFGDRNWIGEPGRERDEELADAVNYEVMLLYQEGR